MGRQTPRFNLFHVLNDKQVSAVKIQTMSRWCARVGLGALVALLSACPLEQTLSEGTYPKDRFEAWRFLTHATFGPTDADIERVDTLGYEDWIDEQFNMTPQVSYRRFLENRQAELKADFGAAAKAGPNEIIEGFYTRALTDPAQLRHRLVFALSEIFVVSMANAAIADRPSYMAGYLDMLEANLNGNYRTLLESVTKSPAMGQYLTFRSNQKEDPATGRIPDENYAREVMQLFSIGLYELQANGTLALNANQQPKPTYGVSDIKGLAKVFTGWSNDRGSALAGVAEWKCFEVTLECFDPESAYKPMVAYPAYHSTSEKAFLSARIAAQGSPDPQASLKVALDTLAQHPNVAPFFSKQLIQRLVTSNPSPEYVERVAKQFLSSQGDIRQVVKAILMDAEAVGSASLDDTAAGKVREPVLRLTAILRAFRFEGPGLLASTSRTKTVGIINTANQTTSFGQSPYMSPSVFNYFRPGYVPPQSETASKGLVAPELQITNETSVTGYVNSVQSLLSNGIGDVQGQTGLRLVLQDQRSLASSTTQLVENITKQLLGGRVSDPLKAELTRVINTMPVPALNSDQSNGAAINAALDLRVNAAILMTAASPEFLIQK